MIRVPGCHRLWLFFPKHSTSLISCHIVVLQPQYCLNSIGLGYSAFARHYLRNHFCFLLLWVLRCFSSPRLPSLRNDWPSTSRVAPFGNLGIKGYLHLHQAYRSLSRPSSPPRAKASTVCPCLLSLSTTHNRVGLIYLKLALTLLLNFFEVVQYVKDLICLFRLVVENNGFEPLTLCVQGRCSSQLS
jgi:hypothetical protein